MDLTLTDDQHLIRESAARFVTDTGRPRPGSRGFDRGLWRQMADLGWFAAGISEAHGGFGGPIETALIAEELGRGTLGGDFLGAAVLGPQLLIASEDGSHRDALLPQVMSGQLVIAAAFSERGANGNLAAVSTSARSHDGGFRLDGTKTLVLAGDVADHLIVSARTSGNGSDPQGISLFIVDPSSAGVTVRATPLVDGS